ncbi:MAG TPA: pilus assembly protein TadG-related protein [Chloroflexota bacterium]|nr:pilus assembly protein TadG-related protein [Chloroflexota bacterium]
MHRRHTASGQILPAVALFLTALLGVCALAIDGSNMYSQRRRLQADLDVAIKVAAARMYNTSLASSVYTYTVAQAMTSGVQTLANDGFSFNPAASTLTPISGLDYLHGVCATNNVSGNVHVKICNPPLTGPFTGTPGYTEGSLDSDVTGFFGGVLHLDKVHMSVRAVARTGGFSTPYALIGLGNGNPTSPSNCSILIKDAGTGTTVYGSAVGNYEDCSQHSSSAASTSTTDVYGTADYGLPFTEGNPLAPTTGKDGSYLVSPVTDPFTPTTYTTPTSTVDLVDHSQSFTPCQRQILATYMYVPPSTVPSSPASGSYYYFAPVTTTNGLTTSIPVTVDISSYPNNTNVYLLPGCDNVPVGSPATYPGAPAVYVFTGSVPNNSQIVSYNATVMLTQGFTEPGNGTWALQAPQEPTTGPLANMAISQAYATKADGSVDCSMYASLPSITFTGSTGVQTTGNVNLPCSNVKVTGSNTTVVEGNVTANTITIQGSGGILVKYRSDWAPPNRGAELVE